MTQQPPVGPPTPRPPAPLAAAMALVAVEAAVLVAYSASLVPNLSGDRVVMGTTSVAFLAAYGVFLGWCGWRLFRLRSWARAPVVMAQLIQVPVGLSFWGGATTPVSVVLVLVAVLVLGGIFHPQSLRALEDAEPA